MAQDICMRRLIAYSRILIYCGKRAYGMHLKKDGIYKLIPDERLKYNFVSSFIRNEC